MKLIDADQSKITVSISKEEWEVIGGVFSMINALAVPHWEDSTGQADTAITPNQFDKVFAEIVSVLDQPGGRAYFTGKAE